MTFAPTNGLECPGEPARGIDVLESVARAGTPAEAWAAFTRFLAPRFGGDVFYCFGGQRCAAAPTPDPDQITMLGHERDAWCRLYFADPAYRLHDPIRTWTRNSIAAIDWSQLEARPAVPEAERSMWSDLRALGIRGGLTIPLHEPTSGRYGSLSIRARHDLTDHRALWQRELPAVQVLALHFHGTLRARFAGSPASDTTLSARERDVLAWVANGLVTKAIARRLRLSPRTVDMHIARAMRKLGARTRSEAASLAVLQGRIRP